MSWPTPTDGVLRIDCDECVMQGTSACADCVVTFLCDDAPPTAITLAAAEVRALEIMHERGLAPALHHRCRAP